MTELNSPGDLVRFLPFPIAWHYGRLLRLRRKSPAKVSAVFVDTLEALLRYVLVFTLGASLDRLREDQLRSLREMFQRPSSLGTVFSETLKILRHTADTEALSVLVPLREYFDRPWDSERSTVDVVYSLINYRNRLSHGVTPTESDGREERDNAVRTLSAILNDLASTLPHSLISVDEKLEDGRVVYLAWQGASPAVIYEEGRVDFAQTLGENEVFAVFDGSSAVKLSPFAFVEELIDEEKCHFWVFSDADKRGERFRALKFSEVRGGRSKKVREHARGMGKALLDLLNAQTLPREPAVTSPRALSRYYPDQPAMIERLATTHVRRLSPGDVLAEMIGGHGGVLLVRGPAGSGKSSWIAREVQDRDSAHHFCSHQGARDSLSGMLLSLTEQIEQCFGLPKTDSSDAGHAFVRALADAAAIAARPVIVFIDALDELVDADNTDVLSFLPRELPRGVVVVVSSRPRIDSTLRHNQLREVDIAPLSLVEAERVATAHGLTVDRATELESAWQRSAGNPQVLLWFLKVAKHLPSKAVELQSVTQLVSAHVERAIQKSSHDLVFKLLALIAVSREPLPPSLLAKLVGERRRTVVGVLREISPLMAVYSSGVAFAHKLIIDHLTDPDSLRGLESDELMEANCSLADAHLAGADGRAYVAEYGAHHLALARRLAQVGSLLNAVPEAARSVLDLGVALARESRPEPLSDMLKATAGALPAETARDIVFSILDVAIEQGAAPTVAQVLADAGVNGAIRDLDADYLDVKLASARSDTRQVIARSDLLLASPVPKELRSRITFLRAEGLRKAGHHREAAESYQIVLDELDADREPRRFLRTSCRLGDLEYVYGKLAVASDRFRLLLDFADTHRLSAERAAVFRFQGQILNSKGEYRAAVDVYERARELAVRMGLPRLRVEAHNSLAEALAPLDPDEATVHAEAGRELARFTESWLEFGKSHYLLAQIAIENDRASLALELAEEARTVLTRVGYGSGLARTALVQANALACLLRWQEALDAYLEASRYYAREEVYPALRATALRGVMAAARQLGVEAAGADRFEAIPCQSEFPPFDTTFSPRLRPANR